MNISDVSKITAKLFQQKAVNYILGRRLCSECAKKEWKNEDKSQSLTMLLGVCEKCTKVGIVAYIEKESIPSEIQEKEEEK